MVETPVLFETFVRVDYARQVWDAIKAAQPKTLYFYSNKGRAEKEGEIERNNEIRSWVNEIDWECDLHTWFRDECVDVYTSLHGAISWLFENEEYGIILEDDCVPTKSFWLFIEHFLKIYKDDKRISFVSGDNYAENYDPKGDHIISRVFYMYGWATWRDRWVKNQNPMTERKFLKEKYIEYYYTNKDICKFWRVFYEDLNGLVENTGCWDYLFAMNCIVNKQYGVCPNENLIMNVGAYGTHSNGEDAPSTYSNICDKKYTIEKTLIPFEIDEIYENIVLKKFYGHKMTTRFYIRRKLGKIIPVFIKNALKKSFANVQSK